MSTATLPIFPAAKSARGMGTVRQDSPDSTVRADAITLRTDDRASSIVAAARRSEGAQ
jgi:hypothetical protein